MGAEAFSDSMAESSLSMSSISVGEFFVASSASAKESSWRNSSSTSWNKVEFEVNLAANGDYVLCIEIYFKTLSLITEFKDTNGLNDL